MLGFYVNWPDSNVQVEKTLGSLFSGRYNELDVLSKWLFSYSKIDPVERNIALKQMKKEFEEAIKHYPNNLKILFLLR